MFFDEGCFLRKATDEELLELQQTLEGEIQANLEEISIMEVDLNKVYEEQDRRSSL